MYRILFESLYMVVWVNYLFKSLFSCIGVVLRLGCNRHALDM